MKYAPQEYNLCVNTVLIDRHLAGQDFREEAFDYVYTKIMEMFRDQLETVEYKEDIYDDLYFETKYMIDRDSFDADADEVCERLLSDFNIKGAE